MVRHGDALLALGGRRAIVTQLLVHAPSMKASLQTAAIVAHEHKCTAIHTYS